MSITYTTSLNNNLGMHARVATKFVNLVKDYDSIVRIKYNNMQADGKDFLDLLSLGIGSNREFEIYIEGIDEKECEQAINNIIKDNFGE